MTNQTPRRVIHDISPPRRRRVDTIKPVPINHTVTKTTIRQPDPTPITPKAIKKRNQPRHDHKMTVADHLQELRGRLLKSLIALFLGGTLGYVYHDQILEILIKPLGQQLYYTSPAGGFEFLIKTCIFFGFMLALPFLVYNLLKYVAPAIPNSVKYRTSQILITSSILAILGASFAYFVSLPAALHFLNNFSTGPVTSLITANEYFNFVMIYVAGFAALFQMPLIIFFINKVTPLTPSKLMEKQRVVILGSFIAAAIITPTPDPINQALMAAPIVALYQTSIGVVWQNNKSAKRREYKELRRSQPLAMGI